MCHSERERKPSETGFVNWRDELGGRVLPELARMIGERGELRAWLPDCGAGFEAYALRILWAKGPGRDFPGVRLEIFATDADPDMTALAREGVYAPETVEALPAEWRDDAFQERGGPYRVNRFFRKGVAFARHDVGDGPPAGRFHLILLRDGKLGDMDNVRSVLVEGGALVRGTVNPAP